MTQPVPNFHIYVPVGVTKAGRELFRMAVKVIIRKFADAEKWHNWKDLFLTAPEVDIQRSFRHHVEKGDPRDVAILCFIMIFRGYWITKSKEQT